MASMHPLTEYLGRLKNVSFHELAYRLKRWAITRRLEKFLKPGAMSIDIPKINPEAIDRVQLPEFCAFENHLETVFSENDGEICRFENEYRSVFFSKIKVSKATPDIRSIWEPARLQEAAGILLDPHAGAEALEKAKSAIFNWLEHHPFLFGPHYLSPMECGLRIPVFFYLLKNNKMNLSQEEIQILSRAMYSHGWWVYRNLALYSSLGNHTVCECIGLTFGGAIFQETKEGKRWLKKGCGLLEQELFHQISDDGGPAEQSFNYHRFVLDLYWLAVSFLEQNRLLDCTGWKDRLRRGEQFLTAISYDGSHFPSVGDSDDGHAVAPGIHPLREFEPCCESDLKNVRRVKTFETSGYTVIRDNAGLFMTFDHGPLGMAPLYNHGHADALSVTLYKNNRPFFIDPGTFRYNGVPEYRTYFKGTRAHNTVCIDDKDQAEQVTRFIWEKPYTARLQTVRQTDGEIYLKASHDGYKRLSAPVVHQREIIIYKDTCCLIVDTFYGKEDHEYELNLHLDPLVRIKHHEDWLVLCHDTERIFVHNPGNCFSVVRGRENPLLGWCSPAYGVLEKTDTLHSIVRGKPEKTFFMTLLCQSADKIETAIHIKNNFMEKICNAIQS